MSGEPLIILKNVGKTFGEKTVLKGVDMTINRGMITGLYGESGCGKSTLARILCGTETPGEGEIKLNGESLYLNGLKFNPKFRGRVQMVWQQPYSPLDPVQKIGSGFKELVAYHKLAKGKRERDELISSAIEAMQLPPEILTAYPSRISGGEAQRVVIARCMLLNPELLILDEATSMLDSSSQASVMSRVKSLAETRGVSVLLISHDKELVNCAADVIYKYADYSFGEVEKL